jgi:hypothetical protein
MSIGSSTHSVFFLLLSIDVKFANSSLEKTPTILNQLKYVTVFYNQLKIDYRNIISVGLKFRYFFITN